MKVQEITKLVSIMSLQEKIDQMLQIMGFFYMDDEGVLTGPMRDLGITQDDVDMAGSILGTFEAEKLIHIQKKYMEKQPHHIPMLFMADVIHGMKTIFPPPIAQGATFNLEMAEKCASVAAKEASISGLHVVFSPMVDLVHDARWGRVMESTGEDPYLNSCFAEAQVKGFQGDDMGKPYKVCACIKHFAAYGGAIAGRDYNTVELSDNTLRNLYLAPYEAGVKAGAGMVMTSFNTVNGVPATTNKWLMRDILRNEMGFDGVLISDFSAIKETIAHGYSKDETEAAKKAIEAGVDIDMMSNVYAANLVKLVEEGKVDEKLIDDAVLRILLLKNKLGLFENPYKDASVDEEKTLVLTEESRKLARQAASESFVLLKNDENILPLDLKKKIAFIGPYTDNKEMISSWAITGNAKDCVTIKEAAEKVFSSDRTVYVNGSPVLGNDVKLVGFGDGAPKEVPEEEQEKMMREAVSAAKEAEVVVMPIGEHYMQSGEATSRGFIDVPEVQMKLFREIAKVNENIVVVLFNGRPLDLREISQTAKAVLDVWMPGTEGGNAVVDVLTGKVNPQGKLPMSFPYSVGQVPISYNHYSTGRPAELSSDPRYCSKYIDMPNEPLYPFGYGKSYTEFEISQVRLSDTTLTDSKSIKAEVSVKNIGHTVGTETLQLYLQDCFASVVRPVKELKSFKKVTLQPGEEAVVSFDVDEEMLRFVNVEGKLVSEEGEFNLWIGNASNTKNKASFTYKM